MEIYKNQKQNLIYCPCRQIFLNLTPEEKVRQEVLIMLTNEMNIPVSAIKTEFPLSRIDKKSKQRADIIVYKRNELGGEEPLIVIETKAENVEITNQTLEQVLSYNKVLKAPFVGISNGNVFELFDTRDGEVKTLRDNTYAYKELIHGNVEYIIPKKMKRLPYNLISYERYLNHLLNVGYISEETDMQLQPFIAELQNYLLCGEIESKNLHPIIIEKVLKNGIYTYGNASGGGYTGYYRSFIVKDNIGNDHLMRVGIFGTSTYKNDPTYSSRLGNTYINVAIDNSGTGSNILQLSIDKYFKLNEENQYEVFHTGRQNGFKNAEVISYIEKHNPNLIKNGKVSLGKLPNSDSISTIEGSEFIENLLNYAYLRGELRKLDKVRKKRKS